MLGDEAKQRERSCGRQEPVISYVLVPFSSLQTDSSRGEELGNANQIVSSRGQNKEPFHQAATAMTGLAQAADRLHPAEWLFDPLALDGTDAIAGMSRGARVDCGTAIGIVLRDMRGAAALAAASDKVGGVIVLVAAYRAAGLGIILDHVERGRALGRAVRLGQSRIDDEPVAVLRHQMSHVAELGLLAGPFAEQPRVGVGGRRMRVILALLAMKVAFGIATAASRAGLARLSIIILWDKALHRGPRLDQRAIDREVLAGKQLADLRQVQNRDKELVRDIAIEQPIPVFAECRRVPHRIIDRHADEPTEQQVVVDLL